MRIIIFTHNYPVSKSERRNAGIFVHDFARELAKENSVSVVCPGSINKKMKFDGVTVYFFNWGSGKHLGKLRFWNPLDLLYGLNLVYNGFKTSSRAIKEQKPELSLAMWAIPGGFFAYIAKVMYGISYTVWVLGSDFYVYSKIPFFGFFVTSVLKNARYVFADGISLSHEVSKVIGRKCFFLPSSTTLYLKVKKHIRDKNKIKLTFIGRMELIKGPDILIEAIFKLGRRASNFKVNLIGDGSLLPILKKRVSDAGFNNKVEFYGNVDEKEIIISTLNDSDWLIIPSRSDSIPLVFSEGMKTGTPVIASALPDLKYLIKKHKVGYFFRPGNVDQLVKLIESLPVKKKERQVFSKNTSEVANFFSVEKSAPQFLKIING